MSNVNARKENEMSQTKGGAGKVASNDLLTDLADDEPIARKPSNRESTPFVPNADLMARISAGFGRTGALTITRPFATEKDARKYGRVYLLHALEVAETLEGKSAALRVVPITKEYAAEHDWAKGSVNQYRAIVQLTHARKSKEDKANEAPTEAPAAS